jgi:hypothetical protein
MLWYKIYSPGRPSTRTHYGAVFQVLNVVTVKVNALNLLGCDVSQQFTDVSEKPTVSVLRVEDGSRISCRCVRKLLKDCTMSVNFH